MKAAHDVNELSRRWCEQTAGLTAGAQILERARQAPFLAELLAGQLLDPWGTPYEIIGLWNPEGGLVVACSGPDCEPDTEDDICAAIETAR